MYIVGVDVGGTNIKLGLIENNAIINKKECPTDKSNIINQLISEIRLLIKDLNVSDISHIGIGFPGLIINGKIKKSPNLNLSDCDLASIIKNELGIETFVRNDADMATVAEYLLGQGVGTANMVLLTIGTGIGGGIICNGDLYTGNGCAGELGHILLYKNGIQCNCGRTGCAEKYVSALALSNRAKELMKTMPNNIKQTEDIIHAQDIMSEYKKGDICARRIIDEYTDDLSEFLMNICNIFRPEKIVIGGGITYADNIIEIAIDKVAKHNYGYIDSPSVEIVRATLGNDAGILGAILYKNE